MSPLGEEELSEAITIGAAFVFFSSIQLHEVFAFFLTSQAHCL